jgi:hypothetical protein
MSEIERVMVRAPKEVVDALRALAEEHHRSLNGELVHALSSYALAQGHRPAPQEGARKYGDGTPTAYRGFTQPQQTPGGQKVSDAARHVPDEAPRPAVYLAARKSTETPPQPRQYLAVRKTTQTPPQPPRHIVQRRRSTEEES